MQFLSRKRTPVFLSILSFFILFLLFSFAKNSEQRTSITVPKFPEEVTVFPTKQTSESSVLGTEHQEGLVPVVKVVDGDTIAVLLHGKRETVRLIGINTPETVDPRREVECFGKEASAKAKELLSGQQVRLEPDPTQADRDKYNRLLRYVFFADGRFFNREMIEEGYAYEYTYNTPYAYQTDFKKAEEKARTEEKGLWGKTTCQGKK